ncbi:MAG: polysaccharide biosynthesis protein [Acidobacteriota bacterium]|nr:polysaccharide biosynthesis protein [Acidobacteriota bacterium]
MKQSLFSFFNYQAPLRRELSHVAECLIYKKILITGAGGSIGLALGQEICKFKPLSLILLENTENNLFFIEHELSDFSAGVNIVPILGDINDDTLLDNVFKKYSPEIIFHAAAFKHVSILEHHPMSAIENNVLGTYALAKKAVRYQSEKLVMLSTDKAVNPLSIMGASKRIAELILSGLATDKTSLMAVRFGNVIGSRGSVIPIFSEKIKQKKPLSVTDPAASRYFLTMIEAVNYVFESSCLGNPGDILIPDLREPVSILELAEHLIRESGLIPYQDIPIVFTGLRDGEKKQEELIYAGEEPLQTEIKGIRRIIPPKDSSAKVEQWIKSLEECLKQRNIQNLIKSVCRIVPEYQPSQTILNAD